MIGSIIQPPDLTNSHTVTVPSKKCATLSYRLALQARPGYRGEGQSGRKLSPRWACAYKIAPERAETRLNAITIQVGRTGVLTPVAELEPVFVQGSTIARARRRPTRRAE